MTSSAQKLVWHHTAALLSLGHGVEFRHRRSGEQVVAFIDGYEWRHNRPRSVTVHVMRGLPRSVEQEVKRAVRSFLRTHRRHGLVPGTKVRAAFNA
jgi:hypothetical protein